jgi:selenocysteine lyase/cysteine desulfurase
VPVIIVGLVQLLAWGVRNIAATLAIRTAAIAAQAAALGLSASPPSLRAGHFLGLRFPEGMPDGLPERLAREQVHVSLRGDSLRVTPHLYNHDGDVDRLFAVLSALA